MYKECTKKCIKSVMHVKSWCCRCRLRYLSPLIFKILITDSSYCFSAVFSYFTSYYLGCKAVGCLTNAQYNLACDQASQWGKEGEKQKQKQKKWREPKYRLEFTRRFCCLTMFFAFSVSSLGSLIPGWNLPWITRLIPQHKSRPL